MLRIVRRAVPLGPALATRTEAGTFRSQRHVRIFDGGHRKTIEQFPGCQIEGLEVAIFWGDRHDFLARLGGE